MREPDVATGNYLAGFADGEGCFYIGVHPTANVTLGIQVAPEFHVSQNGERISVLQLFQDTLNCVCHSLRSFRFVQTSGINS